MVFNHLASSKKHAEGLIHALGSSSLHGCWEGLLVARALGSGGGCVWWQHGAAMTASPGKQDADCCFVDLKPALSSCGILNKASGESFSG